MPWLRRHPVFGFFVVAYAIAWAVWIPMAVAGIRVHQGDAWPTHIPGLAGPFVAAFVMSAVLGGRRGVRDLLARMGRWRVSPKWYLVALSPLAFFALAAAALALIDRAPDLRELMRFSGLPTVWPVVMWILLLGTGYLEETGWRGYAVPQLQGTRSMVSSAVIIGALWACWHVPSMFVIQNYRDLGVGFMPGFLIGIMAGSIFLTWLYDGSGGSVLIVAVWHATYNLVAGTAAAHGPVAAIVSTAVMVWAVVIVVTELRRTSVHPPSAPRRWSLTPVTVRNVASRWPHAIRASAIVPPPPDGAVLVMTPASAPSSVTTSPARTGRSEPSRSNTRRG